MALDAMIIGWDRMIPEDRAHEVLPPNRDAALD